MIRSLFDHMFWADAEMWRAVGRNERAAADLGLRKNLHHILMVQRFFLTRVKGETFDPLAFATPPEVWDEFETVLRDRREGWRAWLDGSPDFTSMLDFEPWLKGVRITVEEALTQVVLHSQHHRGQLAMRLRELGGEPPTLDYILWLRERPSAG
jgi:uncharacterized damage-inducible protein DinB